MLAINPTPTVLLTAGQILHALGDLPGAQAFLARAATARPDHAPIRLQQGMTALLSGACREGWARFESRKRPRIETGAEEWHGHPLATRSILMFADLGLADLFHFLIWSWRP